MKQRPDDALLWSEGMLLAPQHFQQQDLRREQLLHFHSSVLGPFHWGVLELKIDEASLAKDLLRISSLDAIMPDGLVVGRGEGDPELQGSIKQAKKDGHQQMMVHLAVAKRGSAESPGPPRFLPDEGLMTMDMLLAGDSSKSENDAIRVHRLRPVLQLRLGGKPADSECTSLPIARLRLEGKHYRLDRKFVPPQLRVSRDSTLGQIAAEISSLMRKKAEQLWGLEVWAPEVGEPQMLAARLRTASLLQGLPALEMLLDVGLLHPLRIYQAICAAAGPLAVLRHSMPKQPILPDYRHDDLVATFDGARHEIAQVIAESVGERYTPHRFLFIDGRFDLQAHFDDSWRGRQMLLGLSRGTLTVKESKDWMREAHIGARSSITQLREKRDPGAGRSPLEPGEADLVPGHDVSLFKLADDSPHLTAGEPFSLWNPGESDQPREIVLYVRLGDGHDAEGR